MLELGNSRIPKGVKMSKTSSIHRTLEIIKELQDGKTLEIKNLALRYDTSERTIRRDFELIGEVFGDILLRPHAGAFAIAQKTMFEDILNSAGLAMLKEILVLSQKSSLDLGAKLSPSLKDALLKNENSPYIFKHKPFEELFLGREKFALLEQAIKYQRQVSFTYTNIDKVSKFKVCPYKIIFLNENFYLASLDKKGSMLLSRIAMISDISVLSTTFHKDYYFLDFLEYMSSPWATYSQNFKENLKRIELQIPKSQSKYFRLKKFHPSQEIISTNDDGSIVLRYMVTNHNEVLELIKKWIPYVKVLYPRMLQKLVKDMAKKFYNDKMASKKSVAKNLP